MCSFSAAMALSGLGTKLFNPSLLLFSDPVPALDIYLSKSLRSLFNICLLCWDLPGLAHKAWFTQSLKQLSITDGKVLSVAFSPYGCGNFTRTLQKPTSWFSHLRDESDSILRHQCFLTVVRAWGRAEAAPKIYIKGWVWFFFLTSLFLNPPNLVKTTTTIKIHKSQQSQ